MGSAGSLVDDLQLQFLDLTRIAGVPAGSVRFMKVFELDTLPAGIATFDVSKFEQLHSKSLDSKGRPVKLSRKFLFASFHTATADPDAFTDVISPILALRAT